MVNANIKSRQFCSVCKEWLDMEVVPTSDGDEDDGVIWFRCPKCQGFLPKLSGADLKPKSETESEPATESATESAQPTKPAEANESLQWDSPADMMASLAETDAADAKVEDDDPLLGEAEAEAVDHDNTVVEASVSDSVFAPEADDFAVEKPEQEPEDQAKGDKEKKKKKDKDEDSAPAEPIMEYAALLAEKDVSEAVPYRHWGTYEVDQCIHHLAWDDCGVVVAKEELPGGRLVIKVYFEEAGVVRLIEQAPR